MKAPRLAHGARPTTGAGRRPQPNRAAPAYRQNLQELERHSFRFSASDDVEMWRDYRIFKAAGLLSEWRKKWGAILPANFRPPHNPRPTA